MSKNVFEYTGKVLEVKAPFAVGQAGTMKQEVVCDDSYTTRDGEVYEKGITFAFMKDDIAKVEQAAPAKGDSVTIKFALRGGKRYGDAGKYLTEIRGLEIAVTARAADAAAPAAAANKGASECLALFKEAHPDMDDAAAKRGLRDLCRKLFPELAKVSDAFKLNISSLIGQANKWDAVKDAVKPAPKPAAKPAQGDDEQVPDDMPF